MVLLSQTTSNPTMDRYALFGDPVAQSPSPLIHAWFARQCHQSLRYDKVTLNAAAFPGQVRAFFGNGGQGLNITVPHKQAALEVASIIHPRAAEAGAANTLWWEKGQIHADNTDGTGLVEDLCRHGISLTGRNVVILGAGGAARGIVAALSSTGVASLVIANRTLAHAEQLLAHVLGQATTATMPPMEARLLTAAFTAVAGNVRESREPLVINALAAKVSLGGLALHPAPTDRAVYYDLKYVDNARTGLNWAKAEGFSRLFDGWGMLVLQAAASFEIWRGVKPEVAELIEGGPDLLLQ